ncbi:DUF211 domain-containing protein [Candidatus Woesearchaeota archaeon]|nr:DUF211 domain-containing protein [Candidatus Woesearchaeota archaeon]
MGKIRLIVLDILKPHQPSILELASQLSDLKGVDGVDITVYEIDSKVENVKATIKGAHIEYPKVRKVVDQMGGTIHSIDKVACGHEIVKEVDTHQDNH